MTKLIAIAIAMLGAIAIFILISLLFIKLGWYLFVMPVFGLPDLTWMQALGFSFLASAFKTNSSSKKD